MLENDEFDVDDFDDEYEDFDYDDVDEDYEEDYEYVYENGNGDFDDLEEEEYLH
jgi:hypothetical protein